MRVIHLPWTDDLLPRRAACGRYNPEVVTFDYKEVTCSSCRHTMKYEQHLVEPGDMMTDEQRGMLRQEFRATMSDTIRLMRDGKSVDAQMRFKRGFDRQVRLSGLDRQIREGAQHES
jgi:hypothetical protein